MGSGMRRAYETAVLGYNAPLFIYEKNNTFSTYVVQEKMCPILEKELNLLMGNRLPIAYCRLPSHTKVGILTATF
ncbi:MAG: hypothetical protein AAF630_04045 [Cyanobacteria bacterium P01_C01_bin.38]